MTIYDPVAAREAAMASIRERHYVVPSGLGPTKGTANVGHWRREFEQWVDRIGGPSAHIPPTVLATAFCQYIEEANPDMLPKDRAALERFRKKAQPGG